MKKKTIVNNFLLILGILLCCSVKSVSAWFGSSDDVINTTGVGINDVAIEEEFPDPEIHGNEVLKKEVFFLNTGKVPCYVRAGLFFDNGDAEQAIAIDYGSSKWKQHEDGYYYYQDFIQPGQKTEPLIRSLTLKEGYTLEHDFDLVVYTETVQSAGNHNSVEAFENMEGEA